MNLDKLKNKIIKINKKFRTFFVIFTL